MSTRQSLDVNSPLGGVEIEDLQGALLAQALALVDELVAAVVSLAMLASISFFQTECTLRQDIPQSTCS